MNCKREENLAIALVIACIGLLLLVIDFILLRRRKLNLKNKSNSALANYNYESDQTITNVTVEASETISDNTFIGSQPEKSVISSNHQSLNRREDYLHPIISHKVSDASTKTNVSLTSNDTTIREALKI